MHPPDLSSAAGQDPRGAQHSSGLIAELSASDLAALAAGELVSRSEWLGCDRARAVLAEALVRMGGPGALSPAGFGRGSERRVESLVRGDEILWLDPPGPAAGDTPSPLDALLRRLDALRAELSLGLRIGLGRTELQLARYVLPGAGYQRHRDAPRGGTRRITAVYYLNPDWSPTHGGALRVHPPNGSRDVEPRLDRLVIFASELLEHEVLPVFHPRLALTAWFGADDPLGRLR